MVLISVRGLALDKTSGWRLIIYQYQKEFCCKGTPTGSGAIL
jgi:hypothetical protein